MLPLCDRVLHTSRDKYLPSRNRGIPVPKEPRTIGGHLRRRRLQLRIFQSEAARLLGVSTEVLSRWEWDTVFPAQATWPRLADYLGYDPFMHRKLSSPKGNESTSVANLTRKATESFGTWVRKHRVRLRKSQKEFARCLGVDPKTLRHWEMNEHASLPTKKEEIMRLTGNLVTA